ncbi:hypothetical protein, partial [Enterococcus faecium]|uniref:hypothetical protein n=1 Tax=Enterococcus faecium TaxID=1352 RepID=UPI0034E9367A
SFFYIKILDRPDINYFFVLLIGPIEWFLNLIGTGIFHISEIGSLLQKIWKELVNRKKFTGIKLDL